jgi:hypothetical protein
VLKTQISVTRPQFVNVVYPLDELLSVTALPLIYSQSLGND